MGEENNKLAENNKNLEDEINRLKAEIDRMAAENKKFAENNENLKNEVRTKNLIININCYSSIFFKSTPYWNFLSYINTKNFGGKTFGQIFPFWRKNLRSDFLQRKKNSDTIWNDLKRFEIIFCLDKKENI